MGNANISGGEIAKEVGLTALVVAVLKALENGIHEKGKEFIGAGFEKIQKKITEEKRAEMQVLVMDLEEAGSDGIRASENYRRRQEARQCRYKKTYPEGAPENERESYRYGDEDKMNELLTKLYMALDGGEFNISKELGNINKLLEKLLVAINESDNSKKKSLFKTLGELKNMSSFLAKLQGMIDEKGAKKEKMVAVFTELGNKSDQDFDMALEALNHDALFQMVHKFWEDIRDVVGDAWDEVEPHINKATEKMKKINEKLRKRGKKRWALWSF